MKVLLLLTPIFLLVGFWLIYYSSRRSRMIQEFSRKLALAYRAKDDGSLEQLLNRTFKLEAPLGRSFSRIRDLADADGIKLFRVTEVLDLSPSGLPQNSHFGRIAVFFVTSAPGELFFLARGRDEFRPIFPQQTEQIAAEPAFQAIHQIINASPPQHTLSVTLMRGGFLCYFEPLVTGSEKELDIAYLLQFAQRARGKI